MLLLPVAVSLKEEIQVLDSFSGVSQDAADVKTGEVLPLLTQGAESPAIIGAPQEPVLPNSWKMHMARH